MAQLEDVAFDILTYATSLFQAGAVPEVVLFPIMLLVCPVLWSVLELTMRSDSPWTGFKVTFGPPSNPQAFAAMPRTEAEATAAGFTKLSNCGDIPFFAGKRYAKDGDTAVVLIYDINGYIAGLQTGIPEGLSNGYPYDPLKGRPFVLYQGKYYITTYFVHPSLICKCGRSAAMFSEQGTGSEVYFQNGTEPTDVLRVPRLESDLTNTLWVQGRCYPAMGMHYWHDARKEKSCDGFFPAFLLYNHGKLVGYGWGFSANLTSPRYEHPSLAALGAFMDPVPDCLSEVERVSSLHVFLTDEPQSVVCPTY